MIYSLLGAGSGGVRDHSLWLPVWVPDRCLLARQMQPLVDMRKFSDAVPKKLLQICPDFSGDLLEGFRALWLEHREEQSNHPEWEVIKARSSKKEILCLNNIIKTLEKPGVHKIIRGRGSLCG